MKKFITAISLQGKDLQKTKYKYADNPALACDEEVSFPILITINNFVQKGDNIKIVPIIINAESSNNNYTTFNKEIEELAQKKGFSYEIQPVIKELGDTVDDMLQLFSSLIENVSDEDHLFACITYGTKPISILEIMALHYAYKVKKDVKIEKIVYGSGPWEGSMIYDTTPLFYVDSSIESLAKLKLEHPENALRVMLGLE